MCIKIAALLSSLALICTTVQAKEHPGKEQILKDGYQGPKTCETCHPGKAREFLGTVHWKHASKVDHVDNVNPDVEYGMKNRALSWLRRQQPRDMPCNS